MVMPPVRPSTAPRKASCPAESDDEGRNTEIGRQPAVHQAKGRAGKQNEGDSAGQGPAIHRIKNGRDTAQKAKQGAYG